MAFVTTHRAMTNITFSADEALIEAARKRANARKTSLNAEFRRWLTEYTRKEKRMRQYDDVVARLSGKLRVGRKLTREEMNER